ncbi:MAG: SH3 domain-containing protein [Lachnospiraceae bacterium]|nr:SH3 domain-containing protein [Lachnospiraceae bacterium]
MRQKTTKWIVIAAIATTALSLTACRNSADPNAASTSSQALPIVLSGTSDSSTSSTTLPTIPTSGATNTLSTTDVTSGVDSTASSDTTSSTYDESRTGTLNTGVNLRSSASNENNDNIINTIEEGETVTILGSDNGWYHVEYDGQEGYVKSEYVD